jgi:hypothetical protein
MKNHLNRLLADLLFLFATGVVSAQKYASRLFGASTRFLFRLPLPCLLLIAASARAQGLVIPANPAGTDIDTAYSSLGVTFSDPVLNNPPSNDGNVYANGQFFAASSGASTTTWLTGYNNGVQATFATPQASVSINVLPEGNLGYHSNLPGGAYNTAFLEAFDTSGNYIGETTLPGADLPISTDEGIVSFAGITYTLVFTSGSANIKSVIFSMRSVTQAQYKAGTYYLGEFNYLSFNSNLSGNKLSGAYPLQLPEYQLTGGLISSLANRQQFRLNFAYYPYGDHRVLKKAKNLDQPLTNWTVLDGPITEAPPGQYQFTDDLQSTNTQGFYRVSKLVGTTYIGNSLAVSNGAPDGGSPLVILGEYNPTAPLATSTVTLPSGTVQDVQFYGQNYNFTLYALALVTNGPSPNEQTFKVVASESFSGSPSSVGCQTVPATRFSVSAGDLLAFAGTGPYYPQSPNDAVNSDATYESSSNPGSSVATPPGGPGSVFTVGINPDPSANYEYISDNFGNQGRSYCIGVNVSP